MMHISRDARQRTRKNSTASSNLSATPKMTPRDAAAEPKPKCDELYQTRVEVLDPLMKTGFMHVPMTHTFPTRGLEDWLRNQGGMKKDLSLCCLFIKGRCNLGAKCHQIHANHEYVTEQRRAAVDAITCCAHCGDEVSRSDAVKRALARAFPDNTVLVSLQDDTVERVPVERLGWTHRLQSLVEGHTGSTPPMLQWARVCRLHQQARCKYGSHCKNFHLCHDMDLQNPNKEETGSTQAPSEAWTTSLDGTPKSMVKRRGSVTPPPLELPNTPQQENTALNAKVLDSPVSEEKVLEWASCLVFSPSRLNNQACSFEFQVHHPLFTPQKVQSHSSPLCK